MNEKVYMHAINSGFDKYYAELDKLKRILESKELLSLRKQGKFKFNGYNGLDYISLCDYEKRNVFNKNNKYYSSFYSYIRFGISLAFNKDDLDVIIPNRTNTYQYTKTGREFMIKHANSIERYSDFKDEVQVKDSISLDYMSYVTFPTESFFYNRVVFNKLAKCYILRDAILKLDKLLKEYNYDVDIFDIDSKIKLDEEGIKKLIYSNNKK